MAIYPGAVFKPTSFGGRVARNRQGRGILHVAVSRARSLPPWNANTWHFYVAFDGYCEQYVDTDFRAYASGDANDDAISIETAGGTGSSAQLNAEEWTPAQAARIADIMRWESQQPGGAPLELLPDSRSGRRGWGPHRLGVTHSLGLGAVPGWRVPGGESWSSSIGKECPGTAKIRQIPGIINMARSGAPTQEDDMFTDDDRALLKFVKDRAAGFLVQRYGPDGKPARALDSLDGNFLLQHITGGTEATLAQVKATAAEATERDAALQAELSKARTAGAADPEALAQALRDALGDKLAADVAARLRITVGGTTPAV